MWVETEIMPTFAVRFAIIWMRGASDRQLVICTTRSVRILLKVSISNISGQWSQIRKSPKKYGTICNEICNDFYWSRNRETTCELHHFLNKDSIKRKIKLLDKIMEKFFTAICYLSLELNLKIGP